MPVTERQRRSMQEIAKRRMYETRVEDTVRHNTEVLKTTHRAFWEQKTDGAIRRSQREQGIQKLRGQSQAALAERRVRLAELLKGEAAQYREELKSVGMTIEERKKQLSERAQALYERREAERQKFVDECYRRQRRAACDDVRSRDSQAVQELVEKERKVQMAMKDELDKMREEQEHRFVEDWKRNLEQADKDENSKVSGIKSRAYEVKQVLDEQVASLNRRREACRQKKMTEDKEELDELARAVEAENTRALKLREEAAARGATVQKFNKERLALAAKAAEEERKHDLTLLNYALKKEKLANERDQDKLAGEKEMAQRYKSYLDGFQKQQEVDDARINAQRLAIENRIWEKKDEEQRNQTETRAYLMSQVHAGRQLQLANQRRARLDEQNERTEEIRYTQEQQENLDREEAKKAAERSAALNSNMLSIREQILKNKKNRALEKQAAYIEARLQQKAEEEHALSVANEGGVVNFHHPLKNTNWYT